MEKTRTIHENDEIDLRDILKVLVKRKRTIITVFLVVVFMVTAAGLFLPGRYEVSVRMMTPDSVDTPKRIGSLVESGIFNPKISRTLGLKDTDRDEFFDFIVEIPKETDVLKVSLLERKRDIDMGIRILEQLFKGISEYFGEVTEAKKRVIDSKIKATTNKIADMKRNVIGQIDNAISLNGKKLEILGEREDALLEEIKKATSNIDRVIVQRDSMVGKKESDLSSLLDTTIVHQIVSYGNSLQNELSVLKTERETISENLKNLKHDKNSAELGIKNLEAALEDLAYEKQNIKNIQLLSDEEPWVYSRPVSRHLFIVIPGAGLLGIILGVLLVFFMELWEKVSRDIWE